jgi:tetratricopeptide (TPR) repeat protein
VRFNKAKVKAWGGLFRENLKEMEESLRVFEGEYSLSDMHHALMELTTTYISNDQLENAIAAGIRSRALSEYSRNVGDAAAVASWLGLTYFLTKLEDEGLKSLEETFKLSKKISDPVCRAFVETTAYWLSGQLIEAKAASKLFSGLPLETMRSFGTGAKIKFFMSSLISGALREFKQSLKAAIAQSLKGAECADETDSYVYKTFNYGSLIREYAALGDKEQAKKYLEKLEKIFDETSISGIFHPRSTYASVKAAYFSSNGQWKEANQFHEEAIKILMSGSTDQVMAVAGERQAYCWTLLQQGRFADAKIQFEKAKATMDSLDKRFVHSNVLGNLIAPVRIEVDKEFNMRLDLVNVAKNPGVLVKVEGLAPVDFKVTSIQPNYSTHNGVIELAKKSISPFTDEVITFTVQAAKAGAFNLNPQLIYIDDLGETKTCKINPVNVAVQPA